MEARRSAGAAAAGLVARRCPPAVLRRWPLAAELLFLLSNQNYYMQIMASSQNGLSIGDSLPHNIVESPAWSETASPPQTPSRTPPARPLPHVWAQAPPSSQGRR
uniref:Uncharacterized protein n=1 Tax=Setaria viridis TaxID=4556 RepID=A0A4U6UWA9_SETVI|nr:hypothetical protein SEVIR_4G193001v2 [Setaria viridis]